MRELLTPKQVAVAIGVSESSLKRWCDRGVLPTVRTAGGHRRLPLSGVLKFLQKTGQPLVNPEVLGLPRHTGQTDRALDNASARFRDGLINSQEDVCRRILFDLYLAGHKLAAICDDVIQPAFEQIGDRWDCGEIEIYQERTACEITQHILMELRLSWSVAEIQSPLAIGGAAAGDHYRLPTKMCELVLLDGGWRASSLGTNLPLDSLRLAILEKRPKLFWLSVSHLADEPAFLRDYDRLYEAALQTGAAFVLGGRAITDDLQRRLRFTTFCTGMRPLEEFAVAWKATQPRGVEN